MQCTGALILVALEENEHIKHTWIGRQRKQISMVIQATCDGFLQAIPFLYHHDIRKLHEI